MTHYSLPKGTYYDKVSKSNPVFDIHDLIGLEMNYINSFDINTEMDFELAKMLFKLRQKRH